MIFTFRALICGGLGPSVWDREVEVSGEDMTFRQALDAVENKIASEFSSDCAIVSLEQVD